MKLKSGNLKKAICLSVGTFTIGIALAFGASTTLAEEPTEPSLFVQLLQSCMDRNGFVVTRTEDGTGKTIYMAFRCELMGQSYENPLKPRPKPPHNFPTGPRMAL